MGQVVKRNSQIDGGIHHITFIIIFFCNNLPPVLSKVLFDVSLQPQLSLFGIRELLGFRTLSIVRILGSLLALFYNP
jgi:hypothetical protein